MAAVPYNGQMDTSASETTQPLEGAPQVVMTWLLRRNQQTRGQPLGMDAGAAWERRWTEERLADIEHSIALDPEAGLERIWLQAREGQGQGCSVRGLVLLRNLMQGAGACGDGAQWRSFFRIGRRDFDAVAEALRELAGGVGGDKVLCDMLLGTAMGRFDHALAGYGIDDPAASAAEKAEARRWRSGLLLDLADVRDRVPSYGHARVLETICDDERATSGQAIGKQGAAFAGLVMHEVLMGMTNGLANPGVMEVTLTRLPQDVPEACEALLLAPVMALLYEAERARLATCNDGEARVRIAMQVLRGVGVACAYLHVARVHGMAGAAGRQAECDTHGLLLQALAHSAVTFEHFHEHGAGQTVWLELCARGLGEIGTSGGGFCTATANDGMHGITLCRAILACGEALSGQAVRISGHAQHLFARHLAPNVPGVKEAVAEAWLARRGEEGDVEPWKALEWLGMNWTQRDWLDTARLMVERASAGASQEDARLALQAFQARMLTGETTAAPARRRRA